MDGYRIDDMARTLAGGVTRRGALRALAGGVAAAATALFAGEAAAKPGRCVKDGGTCGRGRKANATCCAEVCCDAVCCAAGESCTDGGCCPADQFVCGETCCPPGTVACTALDLPSGPVVGCLCADGLRWDREPNACLECPEAGTNCNDGDCCGDCCDGVCCGEDERCAGGRCCPAHLTCGDNCCPPGAPCVNGECQACPDGTQCSGIATCGDFSTKGVCCSAPTNAACCCPGADGSEGWAGCCILEGPDANCPPCVYAGPAVNLVGIGGAVDCGCTAETFPDCCFCGDHGGDAVIETCPAV